MRIIADERVAQLASFDFQLNFTVDECFSYLSSLSIIFHIAFARLPFFFRRVQFESEHCAKLDYTLTAPQNRFGVGQKKK